MLVERVEESDGGFVATGRKVDEANKGQVIDLWGRLCSARRDWASTYREELCSTHENAAAIASDAHKRMVGPAQANYEKLVGAQMTRTIPSGSSIGVGEFLYN